MSNLSNPALAARAILAIAVLSCSKSSASVEGHVRTMFSTGELHAAAHGQAGLIRADKAEQVVSPCEEYRATRRALFTRHKMLDAEDTSSVEPSSDASAPLTPQREVVAVLDTAVRLARVARERMDSALSKESVTMVETDAGGHYKITGVEAGNYILWALNTYGGARFFWWHPLTLSSGADTVDLDTRDATAGRKRYCSIPL